MIRRSQKALTSVTYVLCANHVHVLAAELDEEKTDCRWIVLIDYVLPWHRWPPLWRVRRPRGTRGRRRMKALTAVAGGDGVGRVCRRPTGGGSQRRQSGRSLRCSQRRRRQFVLFGRCKPRESSRGGGPTAIRRRRLVKFYRRRHRRSVVGRQTPRETRCCHRRRHLSRWLRCRLIDVCHQERRKNLVVRFCR